MRKLHVLFRNEDLEPERIIDKVVVVLDVLFATTSIVTALEHGARDVVPALHADEAKAIAAGMSASQYLLAGESRFGLIEGFAPPTPLALSALPLTNRRLVYATTNGTVALRHAARAGTVLIGALRNAAAVARWIHRQADPRTVIFLCAGTRGAFNLEDFYGAGLLVSRLAELGACELTDAALAAREHFAAHAAEDCLFASYVGRLMRKHGLAEEVRFAAHIDRCSLVPRLHNGSIQVMT